jgi:SAM-dependent methyltransferase
VNCPLCLGNRLRRFAEIGSSRFFRCGQCGLVFRPPEQRPDADAERAHYGTHENDPADPRYRAFLDRLAAPLARRLRPGAEGLDYGSGPGPALPAMLEERGFRTAVYDPFFAPGEEALARAYDFVTCTETAEHFHAPAAEWARLDRLLRPGGWLGVMTGTPRDTAAFAQWRYARDPTHVCFYAPATMRWIAGRFGWEPFAPARDVTLFRKPAPAG